MDYNCNLRELKVYRAGDFNIVTENGCLEFEFLKLVYCPHGSTQSWTKIINFDVVILVDAFEYYKSFNSVASKCAWRIAVEVRSLPQCANALH